MILYESTETSFLSNGIAVLTQHVFDDLVTEELNGVYKLEFTYPMFAPNAKDLTFDRIIRASTPQGDEPFFIAKTINKDGYLSVTCYHLFYRNTWNFIEDINIVGLGGQGALARVLEGTGFTGIANTTKTANIRIVRYNVVEAIMGNKENTILSRIGGELERTKFTVNLRQRRGRTYDQNPVEIRYAKNLKSYEAEIDYTTVATRVMPKGFDGLILPEKYVVRPGATAPYKTLMQDYETIKAIADLDDPKEDELPLEDAYAALRQAVLDDFEAGTFDPKANYKISFVDLSSTEEYKNKAVLERLYLGDDVRVIHEDEDIDLIARVISYKWKPLMKEYEQIELGNFQQKFTDIQTKIDTIGGKLEEVASRESLTIEHVTSLLTNALGGYVKQINGEMFIMDTEDPGTATKVWRWNINGLGYSGTGINGPYETAITMDGNIVGKFITARSITANQLASDVGQSLDLSSNDSINLIIKDIQVGGENLIRGSQALADKFETYQGSTFTTVSDNMTVPEWDTTTATQVRTTSLGTATLKARWVISNDLAFLADKEMSFSIYAKNNRDNVAVTIGTNRIGEPITLAPLETKRLEYIGVPEGNEGKLLILELHAPTDGHYLDVTLFHPKWELGNIITDWSPHPDEFYAGVTKIDKDGITVAKSNQDINSHLGSNGLVISEGGRDEPGSKAIAGFTDGGAWIGDLKADTIRGDIINTHPGGIINIGSGYNYTSISEALQDMGNAKHLLSDLTFRVYNQLNEDITIRGFTGGMIYIAIMDGGSIHGDIFYYQNASSGYVYGFSKRELLRGSIRASGPSHLFIRGLNIDPNNTSTTAVVTEYGGSAFVMNCDITRCRFGLLAQNGGTITALNNIGLVPGSNAIYNTYNGGVLYARGTMPMGSVKFGGATTGFFYDYTTSQQPSQFQPPTVSPTLITQTFSPTKIETYSHQYGAISSYYPNRAAQNRWDSETGYFEGRITFPGSVRTYINDRNGDTGLKVEMRLRRYSGANGQWSPVAVDKQFTTIGTFSAIDRGNWGNWVQISATLITTSGYTFKFGSQSTGSKYAVWDAAQVRVTKTKNI